MNKRKIHPKEHSMRSFPTVIDGWGGWLVFIFCTKQWRIDQSVPWQMRGGSHSKNGKKSNLWDCFILISCLYLERCEVNLRQKLFSHKGGHWCTNPIYSRAHMLQAKVKAKPKSNLPAWVYKAKAKRFERMKLKTSGEAGAVVGEES